MKRGLGVAIRGICALLAAAVWFCVEAETVWAGERSLLNTIEEEIATILEANRPGVVRIHSLHPTSEDKEGIPFEPGFTSGTGFVFDPKGYILTVEKAVLGAEEIRVTLASGEQMPAVFVASDPASEVAVIRVEANDLPVVKLGNSDHVRVGHYAFVLGNAFGSLTPSFGTVRERNTARDLIQIVAPVHQCYGGAPVFGSAGKAVGMVWAVLDPMAAFRPVGKEGNGLEPVPSGHEIPSTVFVIPINRAIQIARKLVSNGEIAYGWLGVEGKAIGQGVLVTRVEPKSPAQGCGLQAGDVILSYQEQRILDPYHLMRLVMETTPGTSARIGIKRNGQLVADHVRVGQKPRALVPAANGPTAGGMMQRIAGMQQELSGLRQMLHVNYAAPAGPSGGADKNREVLFRKIDNMEHELVRLRRLLQR